MITDSHCHLASARFNEGEAAEIISRADAAGVKRMVTLATCLEDIEANLELARDARVKAAIGIHPCDVHNAPDDAVARLATFAGDARVCAIGETGLDYFHPAPEGWDEMNFRKRQRDFLTSHFELARDAGLNVVIHTRDKEGSRSFEDALEIYSCFSGKVRAVFHCFISDWELGEKVIAMGGLVSFGGVSTFKNAHAAKDAAARCPAGSFMLETDSPYLAPEPVRGKRNEPAFSMHIAERIAILREETLRELAAHTESAVDGFFRWP
ncbi:MAG: TatD family hydrolase [Akkermansiaceae bacterium]|jgi:TatD DNase family protein|nr:TatD family hydrolase [Akkermansiaceae bacterium]MDP4647967.1 TatD family hydrolase [Akkermansiaceae bacterium]MDP4719757.1 TatD family hydrolase [Akkermansiaceae bacterium]MDP4781313.1 TatD family hydrolase [Akkermansiaceae bacterium]MDP4846068.1 TatD family hydrolase [Akkermansiaceae bacterium]